MLTTVPDTIVSSVGSQLITLVSSVRGMRDSYTGGVTAFSPNKATGRCSAESELYNLLKAIPIPQRYDALTLKEVSYGISLMLERHTDLQTELCGRQIF